MTYEIRVDINRKEKVTKLWTLVWVLTFLMYSILAYFAAAKYLFDGTFNDIIEFIAFVIGVPILMVMYLYSFIVTILCLADLKGKFDNGNNNEEKKD